MSQELLGRHIGVGRAGLGRAWTGGDKAEPAQMTDGIAAGYLPFEANAAHLFFQLVSRRYEKGSILITSNRSVGEWGGVFGDPVVATAILDRLLHHSTVITIRGDSCRLREKRRSGLLQKPGTAPETNETAK